MDPLNPNSFNHKFASVNGIELHYVDEGDGSIAIVCCHGFPDLWYGWRYQIPFLAGKGYRVIVPDLRGYGQTESPRVPPNDINVYGNKTVCQDLAKLLDHLNIQKAIFLGHDWGGVIVWRMALYHPERVISVISICTPYQPPDDQYRSVEAIAHVLPRFQYQIYLISPEAEPELDSNVEGFFKGIIRSSRPEDRFQIFDGSKYLGNINEPPKSSLISDKELEYYVTQYKTGGFHGSLNWYKSRKVNYDDERGLKKEIEHPTLMITAGKDTILTPAMTKNMPEHCKKLTIKHIEESGHWVMVEQPDQANQILGEYLDQLKVSAQL